MSFNTVVRVWEVLYSLDDARKAYERVLARPSREEEVAKNVICLLVWLETIMGVNVLQDVSTMASDGNALSQVVSEADAVHSYVVHGHDRLPEHLEGIPTIVDLCGDGRLVDFRFFQFHRDLIVRGLDVIRNTVAPLLFNDHLHAMLRRYEDEVNTVANPRPAPELLERFVVHTRTPPEDSRKAFISFPDGHPLPAQDILDYFEQRLRFKDCIECVEMEEPRAGQTPKHGVIVFRSAELREEVLFDETAISFRVTNNYDMWVQVYQPLY